MNVALLACSAWQPQSKIGTQRYGTAGYRQSADSNLGCGGFSVNLVGTKERHYSLTLSRRSVR